MTDTEDSSELRVEYYHDLRRIVVGWGNRGEVTMRLFRQAESSDSSSSQTSKEYERYYWARQFDPFDSTIIKRRVDIITARNQRRIWKEVFNTTPTEEYTVDIEFYHPTRRVCIADTLKGDPVWASWRIWFIDYQPRPIPLFWRSAHLTTKDEVIAYIDDELDKATLSMELQCYDDHSWKDMLVAILAKEYGINNTPTTPLAIRDLMDEISRAYISNERGQARRPGLQLVPTVEQERDTTRGREESLRRAREDEQSSSDESTTTEESE